MERADGTILAGNVLVERDGWDYWENLGSATKRLMDDCGCTGTSNVAVCLSAITLRRCAATIASASIACRSGPGYPPVSPAQNVADRHGRR